MTMSSTPSLSAEERELAHLLGRLDPVRQPSAALDGSVLAMARQPAASQSVLRRSSPPHLRRWPAAMGLAASLLLAVGIAWQLRPSQQDMPASSVDIVTSAPDMAAGGPWVEDAAEAAAAQDSAEAFPTAAEPTAPSPIIPASSRDAAGDSESRLARQRSASEAAASMAMEPEPIAVPAPPVAAEIAVVAPPPPPAAVAEQAAADMAADAAAPAAANQRTLDQIVVSGTRLPAPPPESAAKAGAAASAPAAEDATRDYDTAGFSTEAIDKEPPANADAPLVQKAWLNRIRALLARGEITAAQHSLGEFHRRYPRYPLPDDLQRLVPPPAQDP